MADTAPHTITPLSDPPSQPPRKQSSKPLGGFKRKRTGCMTCRKRKIKCCERKPTCLNCEKARRECIWVGGGDIFKHDQNPSVAEKRETKFYKASASSWTAEDQQRLTTPSTSTREYQFVSMNNEARESPQPHPPPNLAALQQPSPYAHMDLQALASAATYMPLPPTTYGDVASHGTDAMIDPNLDGGDDTGQSTSHGIMGHGIMDAAGGQLRDEEEFEKRIARVLTAAGETDVQQSGETGNRA